jgi:hypothetical protein
VSVTRVELRRIPSIALAHMALNLAGRRAWGRTEPFDIGAVPIRRISVSDGWSPPVSAEYYRIIDRIARGEQP